MVRDVDHKSFAQFEKDIADFGEKARMGKLAMGDLQGGTFTISNGGVYGSLMFYSYSESAPNQVFLGCIKSKTVPSR